MCLFEYWSFESCKHHFIEIVEYCRPALFKAGKRLVVWQAGKQLALQPCLETKLHTSYMADPDSRWLIRSGVCCHCAKSYLSGAMLSGEPTGREKSMHSLAGWGYNIRTMPQVLPFLVTRAFETILPELLGFRKEIDGQTAALFPEIQFNGAMTSRRVQNKEPWILYGAVADPGKFFYFIANGGLLAEDRELNVMRKAWKTEKQIWMDDFEPRGMSFQEFKSYSDNKEITFPPDTSPGRFYATFVMFHSKHLQRKREKGLEAAPIMVESDLYEMASLSVLTLGWHPDTIPENHQTSEKTTSVTNKTIKRAAPVKKLKFLGHTGIEGPLTKRRKLNAGSPVSRISHSNITGWAVNTPSLLSRRMGKYNTPLSKDLAGQPVFPTYQPPINNSKQTNTLSATDPAVPGQACLDSDPVSQALYGFLENGKWSLPEGTTVTTLEVTSDAYDIGVQPVSKQGGQSGSDESKITSGNQKVRMSTAPAYFDLPVTADSKGDAERQEFHNAIKDAYLRGGQPFPSKINHQKSKEPIYKRSKNFPPGTIEAYDAHGNVVGHYLPRKSVCGHGQPIPIPPYHHQQPVAGPANGQMPPPPYFNQYPANRPTKGPVNGQMPPPPYFNQYPVNGLVTGPANGQKPPPPYFNQYPVNGPVNDQMPSQLLSQYPIRGVNGGSNNQIPY